MQKMNWAAAKFQYKRNKDYFDLWIMQRYFSRLLEWESHKRNEMIRRYNKHKATASMYWLKMKKK